MNKREFAGLVRTVRTALKRELRKRKDELWDEINDAYNEAIKKLYEEAKGWKEVGEPTYYVSLNRDGSIVATKSYHLEPEPTEEAKELIEEWKALKNERNRIIELEWKLNTTIDAWKLKAIESGKLNKEPFPKELYDYLPTELQALLVPEGDEE